jgi:AbrB family looped-hinge helix DNA binding protein
MGIKIMRASAVMTSDKTWGMTIPKVWADDIGLKKGDKIDIYREQDDSLVLVRVPASEITKEAAS